jgi:hypothetical protein
MSIINFEEYTSELNEMELKCAYIIAERISRRVGVLRAVKNSAIAKYFLDQHKIRLGGARIRKIINYIRTKGFVPNLIATSKGYYVSTDPEEVRKYIYSLRQRSNAIARIADAMEAQSIQKIG